jgi:hypothetical protein
MAKRPFSVKGYRAKKFLELVHTDVCGPMSIEAWDGYEYFITFSDDHSKYGYVYLMRLKPLKISKSFEWKSKRN